MTEWEDTEFTFPRTHKNYNYLQNNYLQEWPAQAMRICIAAQLLCNEGYKEEEEEEEKYQDEYKGKRS